MSTNWVKDIQVMQKKYKTPEWIEENPDKHDEFLKFRVNFLREEMSELINAVDTDNDEEIVDALIDLCVVAIGTLTAFNVDANKAWDEVLRANMNKKVGMKPSRPNKLGLPDLIKPKNWRGPNHKGNHGLLSKFGKKKINIRYAIKVLEDCMELMRKKGEDYNHISQIDYYPDGLRDIFYMMHVKMTRMRSVLAKGGDTNFESVEDSAQDLINYAAFFIEYSRGEMSGQEK